MSTACRCCLLGLLLSLPVLVGAQSWHVPHPWRSEAVVGGRDQDYNDERFLQVFSYRHYRFLPTAVGEGIRGSAGSLTGDTLYMDFRWHQNFVFDNRQQAFMLDIQRSEDFDGAFDRQLVGFRQALGSHWQLALQGDVLSDKARSDVYLGARRHYGDGSWLQFNWVLPDTFFNNKTDTTARQIRRPHTFFFQWHHHQADAGTTLSLNYSPPSTIEDPEAAVRVDNRQTRAALRQYLRLESLALSLSLRGELTRRQHHLLDSEQTLPFRRNMASATASARLTSHALKPLVGVHYLWLEEEGWFGRNLNGRGLVERREPLLFAGVDWQLNDRQHLTPTVYVSRPDVTQQASRGWTRRDGTRWIGKLSLPWHLRVADDPDGVLSITVSARLHRAAFGGGNVQFHWPL